MKKHGHDDLHDEDQKKDMPEVDGKNEVEVWKEKYIRVLADYQNLEKRTGEEHHQVRMFAGLVVIEKLLPVVDLLEKAQEHLKDQGLELALKELHAFFYSIGVKKIDVVGKPFDPYMMDCIEIVDGEKNTVIAVVSDGYQMHNKLIRPAKVKVGNKEDTEEIKSSIKTE
jgi:molecular chaperone GrpE